MFGVQGEITIVSCNQFVIIMLQWLRNSTLGGRGSQRTYDLPSKLLNFFTIRSKFEFTKGENIYLWRSLCEIGRSWPTTRISLYVISAVGSCEIGGIVAYDADFTPCNFSCQIARNRWDRGP